MRISMCVVAAAILGSAIGPTADGATGASKYAGIHTVEIISLLGDDINMEKVGPKVFFENLDYKLHTDWHVDAMVTDAIQNALGSQFEIKTSPDRISAFSGMEDPDRFKISRKLASLSGESAPDAYVIVAPYTFVAGPVRSTGLLVQRGAGLFKEGETSFGVFYRVGVYDGRTGAEIDYGTSQWPTGRTLTGHEPPIEGCPSGVWADSSEKLTDEQRAQIRQEISSLITRSIAYTLASAGLLDRKSADVATAAIAIKADPSCHE